MKSTRNLTILAFVALQVSGCWLGASQHAGPGDDGADDDNDNDDGAASDADGDSDADTDTDPWSEHQPGELLGATSVKASGFYDTIWDMAAMPGGGVVVLGEFSGVAKFDPGGPNETILDSDQGRLFMARYDEDLGLVWARHVFVSESPSEQDQARSVAVHPEGGFVVAGCVTADATFGPGQTNEVQFDEVASNDDHRLYAARFDGDGDLLWVRVAAPGSDVDEPHVAAAPDGRVLLVGTFVGELAFEGEPGMGAIASTHFPEAPGSLALAAFSGQGAGLWLRGEGLDSCGLRGAGVWAGDGGDTIVAVESTVPYAVQLGGQEVEVQPTVSLLRYGQGGDMSSAALLATTPNTMEDYDYPSQTVSAGSPVGAGGIANKVCGWGGNEIFLAEDEVASVAEGWDGYVLGLDAGQTPAWVGFVGCSLPAFPTMTVGSFGFSTMEIALNADGAVLAAGGFQKDITFASANLEVQLEMTTGEEYWESGKEHMYIARFSPDGIPDWAVQAGGGVTCFARAVAESGSGAIFVGGSFGKNAVFGAGEPGETELSTSGGWDIFLAKYVP